MITEYRFTSTACEIPSSRLYKSSENLEIRAVSNWGMRPAVKTDVGWGECPPIALGEGCESAVDFFNRVAHERAQVKQKLKAIHEKLSSTTHPTRCSRLK